MATEEARDRRINAANKRIAVLQEKRDKALHRIDEINAELTVIEERREWLTKMPIESNGVVHGDGVGPAA